jgi:hypothetical protein
MGLEDHGFHAFTSDKLERGVAAWLVGALLVGSTSRVLGASPAASAVGGVAVGTALAKIVGSSSEPLSAAGSSLDLSKIRLSLNVGEAVLFPLAAGLALAMSSDAGRRKDSLVLLGAAALGAGVTAAVIASRPEEGAAS